MPKYNIDDLQSEAVALVQANQFPTISNRDDFARAGDVLLLLKKRIKGIEEKRLAYTAPLTKQVKSIKADFDKGAAPYVAFAEELEAKMKHYWSVEKLRVDQLQIQLDGEAAKSAGIDGTLVEVVNDIKSSRGDIATTTVRTVTKWRCRDVTMVPSKFLIVDEKLMNAHVKEGGKCPSGIEYFEETVLSSR